MHHCVDTIISGGQHVSAAEVEAVIIACDGVAECAVIGLPDALWGERVCAVVVVNPGVALTAHAIVRHCLERLAGFKMPRQVLLQHEALPRTSAGEVDTSILIARHTDPMLQSNAG